LSLQLRQTCHYRKFEAFCTAGLLSLAGGGVSAQTVGLSHAVNMLASNPGHEITLSAFYAWLAEPAQNCDRVVTMWAHGAGSANER